jgi:hypothetical protein
VLRAGDDRAILSHSARLKMELVIFSLWQCDYMRRIFIRMQCLRIVAGTSRPSVSSNNECSAVSSPTFAKSPYAVVAFGQSNQCEFTKMRDLAAEPWIRCICCGG